MQYANDLPKENGNRMTNSCISVDFLGCINHHDQLGPVLLLLTTMISLYQRRAEQSLFFRSRSKRHTKCMSYFANLASAFCFHRSAKCFIDQMTIGPLANVQMHRMVNNHPFPMASISGSATSDPTQEKMFRTKLLSAMPCDAWCGMNSVSIVVMAPNTSIVPTPKKKFAIIWWYSY